MITRAFLIVLFICVVTAAYAETEDKLRERIDTCLDAGDMRVAIALRAAWLAHEMESRIATPPAKIKPNRQDPTPEFTLSLLKSEFDRLYANRSFAYKKPSVPSRWSALKDSYQFGHAKGVFDGLCSHDGTFYDGSGERFEAFSAGYAAGLKLGMSERR